MELLIVEASGPILIDSLKEVIYAIREVVVVGEVLKTLDQRIQNPVNAARFQFLLQRELWSLGFRVQGLEFRVRLGVWGLEV